MGNTIVKQENSFLYEIAPPEVQIQKSIDFMHKDLAKSGLTTEDIHCYPTKLQGFTQVPAYIIKFAAKNMWTMKLDQDKPKYLGPKGMSDIWTPPGQTAADLRKADTLWIIEGEKKAAKFYKTFHLPTIGIRGCAGYGSKRFSQDGTTLLLPSIVDVLKRGITINVVFDSDITTNINVQMAAQALDSLVQPFFTTLKIITVPSEKGLDDWLVAHPKAKLDELVEVPLADMAISLNSLYTTTKCIMRLDKNGLPLGPKIMEENARRIIAYRYADRMFEDAYNGYIFDDDIIGSIEDLRFKILCQMQSETHEMWTSKVVNPSINYHLHTQHSNMLLDFMQSVVWDGVPRLNTWAAGYIQANNPKRYIEEWGRLMMTSIMLRVTQPGCQADRLFGLTGRQGIGKTTFFKQLSHMGGKDYYYKLAKKQGTADLEVARGIQSSFIVDMDEGIFLMRSAEEIKSIITDTETVYRKLYTEDLVKVKRGNIFVTTNNKAETLVDPTGSRRFMILRATFIKYLEYEVKLQILAEALAKRDEIIKSDWHIIDPNAKADDMSGLTPEELAMSTEEYHNKGHLVEDTLTEWLERFLQSPDDMAQHVTTKAGFVTSLYLITKVPAQFSASSTRYMGMRLIDMSNNPHLPFTIERYKGQRKMFTFKDGNMESIYVGGISNKDQLSGYLIHRK